MRSWRELLEACYVGLKVVFRKRLGSGVFDKWRTLW
jgi:hypothetical protein